MAHVYKVDKELLYKSMLFVCLVYTVPLVGIGVYTGLTGGVNPTLMSILLLI
jgi:hypothetical protein